MTTHHKHNPGIVYTARRVLRAEGAVVVGVGVLCLLVGWHTAAEIAQVLLIAGVLIVVLSLFGSLTGRNDPHCVEHQSVLQSLPAEDRAQQDQPGSRPDVSQM
jgi:hypothetical protein